MDNSLCVSVPARLADRIESEVLVIRSALCADVVTAYQSRKESIHGIQLDRLGDDLFSLAELPVGLSLTVKMHPRDAARVHTSSWLSDHFALGVLMDVDVGLLQGVRIVTSAGVPVILNLDEVRDTGELISVFHYYVHEPHLQVPVEFFHSMFNAYLNKAPLSLEDMYPESPDTFLYVDESGGITSSARLARFGAFFGEVSDGIRIDKDSPAYKGLLHRRKNIFLSGSACGACEHFDLCGGYLRAVEKEFDCESFVKAFEEMKAKAREIAADLAEASLPGE